MTASVSTASTAGDDVLSSMGLVDLALARRALAARLDRAGIGDRVASVVVEVPRQAFVPITRWRLGYSQLDVWTGQTVVMSPDAVARVVDAAAPQPGENVLEVGTGSGYQTTVLALLSGRTSSIDVVPACVETSATTLGALGIGNIELRCGNGMAGWPGPALFDLIVVDVAVPAVPDALLDQLSPQGRLVAPVGPPGGTQRLLLVRRHLSDFVVQDVGSVWRPAVQMLDGWGASAHGPAGGVLEGDTGRGLET